MLQGPSVRLRAWPNAADWPAELRARPGAIDEFADVKQGLATAVTRDARPSLWRLHGASQSSSGCEALFHLPTRKIVFDMAASRERDYLPTATLETLRLRARLLAVVREFFDSRGYWEVETPLLSNDVVVDAYLEPFVVDPGAGQPLLYLQTSPEFGMKRLLAAGAEAIYQLSKVFRRGERGRLHNPEFTMIEWYRVGDTYVAQMQLVEELVRSVLLAGLAETAEHPLVEQGRSFPCTTYAEAFRRHVGIEVFATDTARLIELAAERGISAPPGLRHDDRDGWLNLLLAELIEPRLGAAGPEFLIDYPASQGALARIRHEEHPVAERFELYLRGVELCNGYQELTNPAELRLRAHEQSRLRAKEGVRALPAESRLLDAMEAGLPESSGVALGFDRLVMFAAGKVSVDDVIPFPIERA